MVIFFLVYVTNLLQVRSRAFHCTFFTPKDPFPRIMVVGGAGFIGSAVVKRLKLMGYPSVKIVGNFVGDKNLTLIGAGGSYVVDEHHDICVVDLSVGQLSRQIFKNVDWVVHMADAVTGDHKLGDDHSRLFHQVQRLHVYRRGHRHRSARHHGLCQRHRSGAHPA